MGPSLVELSHPEVGLEVLDRLVQFLAEGDAIKLVDHGLVEALMPSAGSWPCSGVVDVLDREIELVFVAVVGPQYSVRRSARERAEREARRAADPRRNMPSRFPKGEYGPPLATLPPDRAQPASGALAIASPTRGTTPEERARGLQLSTAEGVVVTTVGRVYKTEAATSDFMFEEHGMIVAQCPRSSQLRVKQEFNRRGQRHVNDRTVEMDLYGKLGLRLEDP